MRNFRQPKKVQDLADRLAKDMHPSTGTAIFSTYRDLICFAAALGYDEGKRTKLGKDTFEIVDSRIFTNDPTAIDLMYILALAEKKDINILRKDNEDAMVEIFEEYTHTGFKVVDRWLKDKPDDEFGDNAIRAAFVKQKFIKVGKSTKTKNDEKIVF